MASEEIRFINAIIGFCTRTGGIWPAPLAAYGYVACGVEREIKTILLGKDRTVVVDLICASDVTHHALCVEVKSATLDRDQADRYQALTSSNVLNLGGLPPGVDPISLSHDVVYVAGRPNAAALIRQFQENKIILPFVAGDDSLFNLVRGSLHQQDVNRVFAEGIALEAHHSWPLHFVPFKSDSPDEDIVPATVRAIAGFVLQAEDFTIGQLAERTVPHWRACGAAEQRRFRETIARLTNAAMREELQGYYERPGPLPLWQAKRERLTHQGSRERLRRLATRFVERVQQRTPFKEDQLDFGATFFDAPLLQDEDEQPEEE